MRVTIPQHHRQFLTTIANQMGTTPAKAADWLFWELKRTGFSFGSSIRIDGNQPVPSYPEFVAPVVEEHREEIEIDPALQRLIALGVCEENF